MKRKKGNKRIRWKTL